MRSRFVHRILGAALLLLLAAAGTARADSTGGNGGAGGATGWEVTSDPRTALVRALVNGTLATAIDPQSLFEVAITDEKALEIESVRIRALLLGLEELEHPARPPTGGHSNSGARKQGGSTKGGMGSAGASAEDQDSTLRHEIAALDPVAWRARLELDRARLDFFELESERRTSLLADHGKRREAARPRETEAEKHAREAEVERQRALEAARQARSEAVRMVSEELARLIALQASVGAVSERFRSERAELTTRRDAVLGWQLRVRDAKSDGSAADDTYVALRRSLAASRDRLGRILDDLGSGTSTVPPIGPNPLLKLPSGVADDQAVARRRLVEGEIAKSRALELALHKDQAAQLLEEVDTLNRERLGLLPYLSSERRFAITWFTAVGWEQAQAEARHLLLISRYHRQIATDWLRSIRAGGDAGISGWSAAAVVVPWFLGALAFWWWARRSAGYLGQVERRLANDERALRRDTPSWPRKALQFVQRIHRPVEWLAFFGVTMWLQPPTVRDLLEVQLLSSVVGWVVGGALVVDIMNAVAAATSPDFAGDEAPTAGKLRLRSLKLVGRTTIVFLLILVLTSRLVGEGTIYHWVLSTCWLSVVPIGLILIRWWRVPVFERLARGRKSAPLQTWVLAHQTGWASLASTLVGAGLLLGTTTTKVIRNWVSEFDLARRAHAFLFKRGLDRLAESGPQSEVQPLRAEALASLDPEEPTESWLNCPADLSVERLDRQLREHQGGVIALVGAQGMGKSTLLRRLQAEHQGSRVVHCTARTTLADFWTLLRDPGNGATMPESATQPPAQPFPKLILVDEAQLLIKPVVGGLAAFDSLLALARSEAAEATWILSLDAALWPLLRRARDARPLFDEVILLNPWNEEQLGALFSRRAEQAGIAPTYEGLLDKLPPTADEVDRQDALRSKERGYIRMLWDHVRGNPGLALEVWRTSLAEDAAGVVHVRPLQVPDPSAVDLLPDASLFILRAILQLAPATIEDIALTTRLTEAQVRSAVRHGESQGYLSEVNGRVRVPWRWLRSVARLLERRHLLVNP